MEEEEAKGGRLGTEGRKTEEQGGDQRGIDMVLGSIVRGPQNREAPEEEVAQAIVRQPRGRARLFPAFTGKQRRLD